MNINASGLVNKAKAKADWIAFLASAYERFDGDVGRIFSHYTSASPLNNLNRVLKNPAQALKHRLWNSDHAYTGIFKLALIARGLVEVGILPSKYKTVSEKVMFGAGAAAVTLPASDLDSQPLRSSGGHGGESPSWRYHA